MYFAAGMRAASRGNGSVCQTSKVQNLSFRLNLKLGRAWGNWTGLAKRTLIAPLGDSVARYASVRSRLAASACFQMRYTRKQSSVDSLGALVFANLEW